MHLWRASSLLLSMFSLLLFMFPSSLPSSSFFIAYDVRYLYNISDQPTFLRSLNSNYTLSENSNKAANWICIATGNPNITIAWNINGKVPGSGYSVSEKTTPIFNGFQIESTLTLLSITRNRSTIFGCNVTNSLGTIQSMSNLIVNCMCQFPNANILSSVK